MPKAKRPLIVPGMTEDTPAVTKYQTFNTATIKREDIKEAEYNPRTIDPHARKKLRASLERNGLVETLVWNQRTGRLVGGHQRLSQLDDLEGSPNYSLTVAAIDVDEHTEKRLNIELNNRGMQGDYDAEQLGSLLSELVEQDKKAAIKAGFDEADLQLMGFEDEKLSSWFKLDKQPEAVQELVGEIEGVKQAKADEIKAIKDRKKEAKAAGSRSDSDQFYCQVIFEDEDAKRAFLEYIGEDPAERMVSGARLMTLLQEE